MEIRRLTRVGSRFCGEQPLCGLLTGLGLLLAAGCNDSVPDTAIATATTTITATASNPADRIVWVEADVPTLHITSPSGIGSARLLTRNGAWPDVVDVTLDLKALEGFTVKSGGEAHRLELTAGRRVLLEPADSALQWQRPPADLAGAGITVRIAPARFAEPASELILEWVDYYR